MAHSVERLEQRLEVQDYKLNALLDVTQGINARATEAELLEQYRVTLAENLSIHRLVLYANDDGWKCLLTNGVAGEIPAVLEASFFDKGGQVRLHSSQGNEDFDVVIPVLHNGAPIAYALLAGDTEEGTGVSPVVKHLRFIELLTNVLIVALQNKRLELERVRQEATRRELELAADLQSMLVPADWPRDRDVDVAAFYKPHLEVGGDYYDVFSVDEDRLVFCMADVSGKGIAAAFLMSDFQANLRAIFQYEPSDLAKVVTQLNKRVMDNAKGEKYITLFAAVYNRRDQSLQYINCGHNPPVLMSADAGRQQLELGMLRAGDVPGNSVHRSRNRENPAGSHLLCYTGQIGEQENSDDVPFGMQRMEEVVRERRGMPVDAVQEALIEAVRTFKGSEPSTVKYRLDGGSLQVMAAGCSSASASPVRFHTISRRKTPRTARWLCRCPGSCSAPRARNTSSGRGRPPWQGCVDPGCAVGFARGIPGASRSPAIPRQKPSRGHPALQAVRGLHCAHFRHRRCWC